MQTKYLKGKDCDGCIYLVEGILCILSIEGMNSAFICYLNKSLYSNNALIQRLLYCIGICWIDL